MLSKCRLFCCLCVTYGLNGALRSGAASGQGWVVNVALGSREASGQVVIYHLLVCHLLCCLNVTYCLNVALRSGAASGQGGAVNVALGPREDSGQVVKYHLLLFKCQLLCCLKCRLAFRSSLWTRLCC